MSRVSHENPGGSNPNPAQRWIEYNAKNKEFSYYDKEIGDDVVIDLKDMEFMFISQYHGVGGWHDTLDTRIFSNEVFYIGTQPITALTKKGPFAEGLYKDIKADVAAAGGNYIKAIYVVMKDGTLARIQLKGSAVKVWGDFVEANKSNLEKNWIKVSDIEDMKKGSIRWGNPVIELGKKISAKDDEAANEAAAKVQAYFTQKFDPDAFAEGAEAEAEEQGDDPDPLDDGIGF